MQPDKYFRFLIVACNCCWKYGALSWLVVVITFTLQNFYSSLVISDLLIYNVTEISLQFYFKVCVNSYRF
jgi:hypothetical protein